MVLMKQTLAHQQQQTKYLQRQQAVAVMSRCSSCILPANSLCSCILGYMWVASTTTRGRRRLRKPLSHLGRSEASQWVGTPWRGNTRSGLYLGQLGFLLHFPPTPPTPPNRPLTWFPWRALPLWNLSNLKQPSLPWTKWMESWCLAGTLRWALTLCHPS